MTSKKRLFLVDAYALIFRGYYALIKNPAVNSKGVDTSAILGFTNSLLDLINKEKPNLLAVAFDKGGSALRSEVFTEYKSNRKETPEAIKLAVPYIQKLLNAMHIPIIEKAGYEADDLIGTLSKQAEKEGYQVFMVTPDKDFAQLVSENIFMYKPARSGSGIEVWGIAEVQKKFEVQQPLQVIDYLGMMGDAVDNIPGLPGVGEKTAKKFINQFGSMENLLANTDQLKGKLKEKIEQNKEIGLLSKKLATILLDCPVNFEEKDFELENPDFEKVDALFAELEFRRTSVYFSKIFKREQPTGQLPTTEPKKGNSVAKQLNLFSNEYETNEVVKEFKNKKSANKFFQYVNTKLSRKWLLTNLLNQKVVSFQLAIAHEKDKQQEIIGIAFSYSNDLGYFVAISEHEVLEILEEFKAFFESEEIKKIGYDLKSQLKLLKKHQVELRGALFDIQLAHYLLHPDRKHDLEVLAANYLNYQQTTEEVLLGKGQKKIKFNELNLKQQSSYFAESANVCFELFQLLEEQLVENKLQKLYKEVELPLLRVLANMELEGINLDVDYLSNLSSDLETDIKDLEEIIFSQTKESFNIASPKQLGVILFEKMALVSNPKKTKTGQYATGEEILSKLAQEHQLARDILDWRGLVKLKNTYVDALPNEVNDKTQRVHTTFSQSVAATGRLSSNNPNLQNIPIRTARGREVRKSFIPRDKDHILLAADYSQIELRIIASLSEDESMIAAFNQGQDIHASTASKVFNIPLEEVSRDQRSDAKAVNFGIIYGQGAFTLSQQLQKSRAEAKELIDNYYATFPRLKQFIAKQVQKAKHLGFVETVLGRKRYLLNINSGNSIVRAADERNAVNAPIQGSAADIIKIAMIEIEQEIISKKLKSRMLLQVHDELVFDVHLSERELMAELIKKTMENAFQLKVPLTVDVGEGKNWLEAH
jgi:DNA polymerase-1